MANYGEEGEDHGDGGGSKTPDREGKEVDLSDHASCEERSGASEEARGRFRSIGEEAQHVAHWSAELKHVGEVDRDDHCRDGDQGRQLSGPMRAQALTPPPPVSTIDCRVETRHGYSSTEEEDCRVLCGDRADERDGEDDPRLRRDWPVRRVDEVEIRAKGDQHERHGEHVAAYRACHAHRRHCEAEGECAGQRQDGRPKDPRRDSADHIGCHDRGDDRERTIDEPVRSKLRRGPQQQIEDWRMRVDVHVPPEACPRGFAGDEDVPPAVVVQALVDGHVQHRSRSEERDRRQERARAARFVDVDHKRVREPMRRSADAAYSTHSHGAAYAAAMPCQ